MTEPIDLGTRVGGLERRLDILSESVDRRFDQVDERFDQVDNVLKEIAAEGQRTRRHVDEAIAAEGERTRRHFDVVAEQMKSERNLALDACDRSAARAPDCVECG